MAKTTHEKQLERARARRQRESADRRRARNLVVSIVAVLVVGAVVLAGVLLARGDDVVVDEADEAATEPFGDEASPAPSADESTAEAVADEAVAPCPAPPADAPAATTEPYADRPAADLGGVDTVTATVTTSCGEIVLALDAAAAPTTVGTWVALAEDGYFAGVPFHRVIDGFMIQGGDPTGTGTGCLDDACSQRLPGFTFEDELTLAEEVVEESGGYPRGTVAMANAGADTNGSQFFIVQATPAYPLPPAYAVFGEVVTGMDVVDRIVAGPVDGDLAVEPALIIDVLVERCAPSEC